MTERKDRADVKIAPPILTILHIVAAYLLAWFVPLSITVPPILEILASLLLSSVFYLAWLHSLNFAGHVPRSTLMARWQAS